MRHGGTSQNNRHCTHEISLIAIYGNLRI